MKRAEAMVRSRAPWWMYVFAVVYALTLLFNARQEMFGPAASGLVPAWPGLAVAGVRPGTPLDKSGLRAGDVLETIDGLPLRGMPDWFLARANFEVGRPVELQVRRGEQRLRLQFVITTPAWRTWRSGLTLAASPFYLARLTMLLLAIFVAFSRPKQISARLVALMFAMAAVAEGYPSPGWAAALRGLPVLLALPICLATASWLLGSIPWLLFFAIFPRVSLNRGWRWTLAIVHLVTLCPPLIASANAMIDDPSALAKPWPLLFEAAQVRWIQDLVGVAPLLFFNVWPWHQPRAEARLLELWLAVTVLYLGAGFVLLLVNYRRLQDVSERRRLLGLLLALVISALVVVHNFFVRNWTNWYGTLPPAFVSGGSYVAEAVLFMPLPLVLAYLVLRERVADRPQSEPAKPLI